MPLNLQYRIVSRKTIDTHHAISGPGVSGPLAPLDAVSVVWTQANGELFPNHKLMVETRMNPETLELEKVEVKVDLPGRKEIWDTINITKDSPDSLVLQICEDKRLKLAATLGVEP